MGKATAPIDLLREFRQGFEGEANYYRSRAAVAPDPGEEQSAGAKAFVAEQAVKKIDATLRDWG